MPAELSGTEEAAEIGVHLGGEFGGGDAEKGCQAGVGGFDVAGMIHGGAVGRGREFVSAPELRGDHRGGVGFDEQAVEGDGFEGGLVFGVARVEEGSVEGEIGAAFGEGGNKFGGAAVGVKKKTAFGDVYAGDDFGERAPGLEAVDGDGAVFRAGKGELFEENFALFGERGAALAGEAGVVGAGAVEDPAVDTDFADGGVRVGIEVGFESGEPVRGTVAGLPRVEAVAGADKGVALGESRDAGPVGFAGAVDNHKTEADGVPGRGDAVEMRGEPIVLEVVVGVVEHQGGRRGFGFFNAKTRRTIRRTRSAGG